MTRFINSIALLLTVLLISACLDTDLDEPNTEFRLNTTLVDDDERFSAGGDEMQLFSVRFMINNIEVVSVEENEIFESNPIFVNLSSIDMENIRSIGISEIFGGNYTGVKMDLTLPPTDGTVEDDLLIVRDESTGDIVQVNSMAIAGTYNSMGFTIQTDITPELEFSFDRNINMPETSGLLEVTLIAEWKEWFLADDRESLLDPNDEEDREEIIDNFKRFFTAQTLTIGEL